MTIVRNVISMLPSYIKRKLFTLLSDTIDIDKIENTINKYNLYRKAKEITGNGLQIDNISSGISNVTPTNESVTGLITAILVIAIITFIFNSSRGGFAKLIIAILAICALTVDNNTDTKDIYIVKNGKKHKIEIVKTSDSTYKVIDETEKPDDYYDFHVMSKDETDKYMKSKGYNESVDQIKIYGKNKNDEPVIVAYAGTDEMASDLIKDFENNFDEVWAEDN